MKDLLKKAFDKGAEVLTTLDEKVEEKSSKPREGSSEHEQIVQAVAGQAVSSGLKRSVELLKKGRKGLE